MDKKLKDDKIWEEFNFEQAKKDYFDQPKQHDYVWLFWLPAIIFLIIIVFIALTN
jgi:hypothetical protein